MPELPEVEVVSRTLKRIINKKILKVELLTEKLREPLQKDLELKLKGKVILDVYRKGKYLVFKLDKGFIVGHLGMTGKFVIDMPENKFDRVVLQLSDNMTLRYNDIRKFGFVLYEDKLDDNKYLRKLGIEPLTDDFNTDDFFEITSKSKKTIKQFLLDQSFVAGLGNIYVIEIMYLTKINPLTKMNELNKNQIDNIVNETKKILNKSIEMCGSSISDYVDADNKKGNFQNTFNVYNKKEDKLGNEVVRITQNGRSTYYCPSIQK